MDTESHAAVDVSGALPQSGAQVSRLDHEQLERLFAELAGDVRRVARATAPDAASAEDVVQETFLRLAERLDGLRDPDAIRGWLKTVARNAALDARRRSGRWAAGAPSEEPAAPETDDRTVEALVASWLPAFVEALPEPYREAVRMADLEELPQAEIARRLGAPPSTIKSRVQRGRKLLRKRLLACCHVELGPGGDVLELRRQRRCRCD